MGRDAAVMVSCCSIRSPNMTLFVLLQQPDPCLVVLLIRPLQHVSLRTPYVAAIFIMCPQMACTELRSLRFDSSGGFELHGGVIFQVRAGMLMKCTQMYHVIHLANWTRCLFVPADRGCVASPDEAGAAGQQRGSGRAVAELH